LFDLLSKTYQMKKVLLLLILTTTVVTQFISAHPNTLTVKYNVFYAVPDDSIPLIKKTNEILSGSIKGRILNKVTGETIPGAAIYIPDLKKVTVSDVNGNYSFENLPKAKFLVKVSYLGFKTILENIDFATVSNHDFLLEPSITEINEVVITGSSRSAEITRSPIPVFVMERKSIDQILTTNIIDAIAKQPGINAVTTGPNVSKPFIHGMGFNRVLTLVDGIRQEGQQWGDEHGIEVDENAISKIEIVKGPASMIYGSDAIAGVVNLIPYQTAPTGKILGKVSTEYQSNNGLFAASGSVDGNHNSVVWGARLSAKEATNYRNKIDGRVYGTAFKETDASGYVGINKAWGYSHLNFSLYNDLQEIPDGSRDSVTRKFTKQITEDDLFRPIVTDGELNSYKISDLHQHVQHYKIYSTNNFILGNSKLGLTLGYQQNIRQEFSHPQATTTPGLDLVLNTLTYDVKYYFPDKKGWESTIGVNGMAQNNTNQGTEFIIPDYNQFDIGPFVFVKKNMGKLDVSAGVRYDTRFFNNNAMFVATNPVTGFDMQVPSSSTLTKSQPFSQFNHTFTGLSGCLGATYRFSDKFIVKANIARGFRAPNISEISSNGVHPGTNLYQIGNNTFKPEFSLQEDLGIFYDYHHMKASLELFNTTIDNYIFNQRVLNHLGQDSVIIKGNQTFKFVQSRAHLYGGEASIDIHPHPWDWLHFENSISVIYAVNEGVPGVVISSDAKYLPFIPPVHTHSELRADIKQKFKYFSSLYANVEMDWNAKQNRVYRADNTETETPGYTLFNAGIGLDLTNQKGKVICNIHIAGNNITDVAYQSHLSRLKYFEQYPVNWSGHSGIYNMGRNISFKLIFPFGSQ
jgi:iron complex outermembrane recepter protein